MSDGRITIDEREAWIAEHLAVLQARIEVAEQAARESMVDAACFRFWVSEAARSPCDMARLIRDCVTEADYRRAIMPCIVQGSAAIDSAKQEAEG